MTQALLSPTVPTGESSALVGACLRSCRVKYHTLKTYLQHTKRESSSIQNCSVGRFLMNWNIKLWLTGHIKPSATKSNACKKAKLSHSTPLWQHILQITSVPFKWMVLNTVWTVKSSTKATSMLYMLVSSQVYMHNPITKKSRRNDSHVRLQTSMTKALNVCKYKVTGFM